MSKEKVYKGERAEKRNSRDRARAIKEVTQIVSQLPDSDRKSILDEINPNFNRKQRYELSEKLREERRMMENCDSGKNNEEGRNNSKKSSKVETTKRKKVVPRFKLKKINLKKMPKMTNKAKALLVSLGLIGSGFALSINGPVGAPRDGGDNKPPKGFQDDISTGGTPEVDPKIDVPISGIETDEVKYMIDFIDYGAPGVGDMIYDLMETDRVGAFIFECGSSKPNYPFSISSFSDVEVHNAKTNYPEGTFTGEMGSIVDLEYAIKSAKACGAEVGIYQYTTANTNQEADIEADYIRAFFSKLKKDLPDLDTSDMIPIAIDIEENGDKRMGLDLSSTERNILKENRTHAILHLIDRLIEDGVTSKEKGVTIYGDLNRIAEDSYVNWQKLFSTLEEKGIRTVRWNTRALNRTFDSGIEYEDADKLAIDLMHDDNNVYWMKEEYGNVGTIGYANDSHAIQAHLGQHIYSEDGTLHEIDVSVTTDKLIKDMIEPQGEELGGNFFDTVEEAIEEQGRSHIPSAKNKSQENSGNIDKKNSLKYDDVELE